MIKKIGIFNDSFPPVYDGVSTVVLNYANELTKNGMDVVVVTPQNPRAKDSYSFEVMRYFSLPMPVRKNYRLGIYQIDFPFMNRLKKVRFDIIHAHCPFSSGRLALKIAKERNLPLIGSFHSKYYEDFFQILRSRWLCELILKWIMMFYRQCTEVWVVNSSSVEVLRSYGYDKDNVYVVENGTELVEEIYDVGSVKAKLGILNKDFVLLYVGQMIVQKNVFLIMDALKILKNMKIDFKMIFVGDGDALGSMRRFTEKSGLQDSVIFMGLIKDRRYLYTIYSMADLFLFPSMYDTSGLVVREAAVCGCPSVLIKGSNASEGVVDGFNGFLIDNNHIALAEKVMALYYQRENLKIVGENARKSLVKSWPEIINTVMERYSLYL